MKYDKSEIKNWWNNHSQDYKNDYKNEYLGIDQSEYNDDQFLEYLDSLDKMFANKAYFAQKPGKTLFSDLITSIDLHDKNVLEIGCGIGSHSQVIAQKGCNLTCIDLAERSIEITKRRFKLKNLNANIIQADCENLPFENNYFDYIWSWGVIHHTPNTDIAAKEIQRVLKPKGRLDIMVYNNNSLYKFLNVYIRYGIFNLKFLKGYTKQDLKNKYTDGKEIGGAPLSKYYSKKELINLFPNLKLASSKCYEQKTFFSFWIPQRYKIRFEKFIPDYLYTYLFKDIGFLLFANFIND